MKKLLTIAITAAALLAVPAFARNSKAFTQGTPAQTQDVIQAQATQVADQQVTAQQFVNQTASAQMQPATINMAQQTTAATLNNTSNTAPAVTQNNTAFVGAAQGTTASTVNQTAIDDTGQTVTQAAAITANLQARQKGSMNQQ